MECSLEIIVSGLDIQLCVILIWFVFLVGGMGARGGVVVKALPYKPAGRGFDSR